MALLQCPDCSASVSDAAPACVKCGKPLKPAAHPQIEGRFRWLEWIGFILATLGVVSCAASGGAGTVGTVIGCIGLFIFIVGRFSS